MMTDPIKTSTSDIIIFPSYFLVNRMNPHSQRLDHDNKNLSFYNKRNNPYYKGLLPYINIKKLTKLKLKTNLISAAVNEFFPQLENKKFLKIHEEPKKDADYDSLEKKNSKLVNFKSLLPKQLKGNFVNNVFLLFLSSVCIFIYISKTFFWELICKIILFSQFSLSACSYKRSKRSKRAKNA